MVDVEKNARFREHFKRWVNTPKHPKAADKEIHNINTTILISNYVDENSLLTIQRDLVSNKSPVFLTFNQYSSESEYAALFGAFLYGKLVIDEYYHDCVRDSANTQEKIVLTGLLASLNSLYLKPSNSTALQLKQLITKANLWLDKHALHNAMKHRAQATCVSLYTALQIVHIIINHLPGYKLSLSRLYGVDIKTFNSDLEKLIRKIGESVSHLEAIINSPTAPKDPVESLVLPVTIDQHFNAECLSIIKQTKIPLPTRLTQIKETLAQINSEIAELLAAKSEKIDLNQQIDHAIALINALDANDLNITGIKYSLALIESQKDAFKSLIDNASEAEKEEWQVRMNQLTAPDFMRSLNDKAQSLLSWATFLPTMFFRAVAPTALQENLRGRLPITFDSECKTALRSMAETRVRNLSDNALILAKAKIKQLADKLGRKDDEIKPVISKASPHMLKESSKSNQTIIDVITEFEKLGMKILQNREELVKIQALSPMVDALIATHDSFLIRLLIFLAKLCSWFKTKTSARVQDTLAMKNTLGRLEDEYTAVLNNDKEIILSTPGISDKIKETVIAELLPHETDEPQATKVVAPKFGHVSTMFKQLKKGPITEAEEDHLQPTTP